MLACTALRVQRLSNEASTRSTRRAGFVSHNLGLEPLGGLSSFREFEMKVLVTFLGGHYAAGRAGLVRHGDFPF